MPNDDILVRFRKGSKSDLPNAITPGELLFATYDDDVIVKTTNGQETVKIVQSDIYLDVNENNVNKRVNIANDVDKARTLFSISLATTSSDGNLIANEVVGIDRLYDGLTVALKINTSINTVYNTLNINNLGAKLIWYGYNTIFNTQMPNNGSSEIILTYRVDAGNKTIQANTGPMTLSGQQTDGWIINNVTGATVLLKTWESSEVS